MYAELREQDPVHHVEAGDYWVLSRFADVWSAARDTATFSSADGLTTTYGERQRIGLDEARPLVMMDPPDHTAFRRLVARGFTPRQVASLRPEVERFVAERLGSIDGSEELDIVELLFKPLPSLVVAHYLGVPAVDRVRFDAWTEAIVAANADGDVLIASSAVTELMDYFGELIEWRRTHPGDDTISHLTGSDPDEDEASLLQILGFAFTMVAGGNDTTTGLLGFSAEALTANRDQRQRLLDDPALLAGAVEELLRLASPVHGLARTTTRPVELHGRTIPAGRKVLLLYASANRDDREFGETANQLDIERRIPRMMTFGYGAHHCLGAAAARMAASVALDQLLTRFPRFEVDAGRGTYAPGNYVRRFATLPFAPTGFG
jgi:cytochrome P450